MRRRRGEEERRGSLGVVPEDAFPDRGGEAEHGRARHDDQEVHVEQRHGERLDEAAKDDLQP